MTSILSWLTGTVSSFTDTGKQQSAGTKRAETGKTNIENEGIKCENDEEEWVLFEDFQNRKVSGLGLTVPTSGPSGTSGKYSAVSLQKPNPNTLTNSIGSVGADASVRMNPLVGQVETDTQALQNEDDFDQTSSIATIEHVKIFSPTISPSIPPDNLSTLLSLVASASANKQSEDRQAFKKSHPRTLQTLAQLKDHELKMKKMKKLAYRK